MNASDHSQCCPPPEILHKLVERTMSARAAWEVIAHLNACRDCRFIVSETLAFLRQDVARPALPPRSRRWWLAAAAAIATIVSLQLHLAREPGRQFDRVVRQMAVRPVEGRLSGIAYQPYVARRAKAPPLPARLAALTDAVLSDTAADAPEWHRHGVASLLKGDTARAVLAMEKSTQLAPRHARYWSDLAAARLAMGMEKAAGDTLAAATQEAAVAVRLDPNLPEGRFNLAIAYQRRGLTREATAAFDDYIALDAESLWAAEAGRRREIVRR